MKYTNTAARPGVFSKNRSPGCRSLAICTMALVASLAAPAHADEDLTTLSLEELMNITIVGASKYEQNGNEVGAAVSVITRQEIKAFGWRTLAEALASLPGVHTTYDRSYTYLGARGFGLPGDLTARLLLNINGNRVNDPVYDGGPAGREFPLDMSLVERIEFIPGPGGAVYGQNAMFGVVNVITRNGSEIDGVETAAAYLSPQDGGEGRASWGSQLDNGADLLVSVTRMRAEGDDLFFDFGSTGISGVANGQDSEEDQELYARVAGGTWSVDVLYGNRGKHDPTASFFSDPLAPNQHFSDSYTLAQLQYDDAFAADSLHVAGRLFAGRYRYRGVFTNGSRASFPAEGDWHGAELRLLSTALENHKLMLGLEAQDNTRTDQALVDHAEPANSFVLAHSGYRIGLYAQDEWRVGSSLTATLGLRVDRNGTTGTQASPRAALIWQASAATTVKALYGRAHRAPNAYESEYEDTLSQIRNTDLGGERIDTLELVADHLVDDALAVRASIYAWTMQDIITLGIDAPSGLTQYQSGATVEARGLELSADKTWPAGVRLRGSVSLQDVATKGGSGLPNSPKLLGKLNASGPLPWLGLRLGYAMRYEGSRLSLDGSRLSGYVLANLNVSTDSLADGLVLSLGVNNLFDARYKQAGADTNWQNAFEQDGRSLRAQLDYRF